MRRALSASLGVTCVGASLALPFVESAPWTVFGREVHVAVILAASALVAAGALLAAVDWLALAQRQPRATRVGIAGFVLCAGLTSASVYSALQGGDGLRLYELRPYVGGLMMALGTLLLAGALPAESGRRVWLRLTVLGRSAYVWRAVGLVAFATIAASSLIGGLVLEAIPHHNDATTYLIQGRVLWSGNLALTPPLHPELFDPSRLKFTVTSAGYIGWYPPGWPVILGFFDLIGVRWLANPLLLGATVAVTCLLVGRHGRRRLAVPTGVLLASSPFLILNASDQLSHVATMFWLLAFLFLMLEALRSSSFMVGLLSGGALGMAGLTRPSDALFFALPCILYGGWRIASQFRRSFVPLAGVAAAGLLGVLAYLAYNQAVTGDATRSTYAGSPQATMMLVYLAPRSFVGALRWLHENIVGWGTFGYLGVFPPAALVAYALVAARRDLRGLWLALATGGSIAFIGTALIRFHDNPWFGPRWLTPAFPALAVALGAAVSGALRRSGKHSPSREVHMRLLNWLVVGVATIWLAVVPARITQYTIDQPNRVDGRVVKAVREAGLRNAVVALPRDPDQTPGFHKDPKAGFWAMQVPFESNDVIYVTVIPGWEELARESYPTRTLFYMNEDPRDYSLFPVTQ